MGIRMHLMLAALCHQLLQAVEHLARVVLRRPQTQSDEERAASRLEAIARGHKIRQQLLQRGKGIGRRTDAAVGGEEHEGVVSMAIYAGSRKTQVTIRFLHTAVEPDSLIVVLWHFLSCSSFYCMQTVEFSEPFQAK